MLIAFLYKHSVVTIRVVVIRESGLTIIELELEFQY